MPRPKMYEEERVQVQIRLPKSLRDQLRKEAASRLVSVNLIITTAIEQWMEQQEQ